MKLLTTKDYIEGAIAIPFLAFSNIVYMNIAMTCFGMNLMEKTRPLAKIMIITAVIKVILNFYFIPKYSFIGAAITTILCNIIFWVLAYRGSQKYFHMKWKLIPSVLYMTIAFLISVSVPFLQIKSGMHINIFVLTLLFMIVLVLPVLVKLIRVQQVIDGYYQVKEIIARWRLRKNESV
jgi:O-antigen/teichoic acid export membrane protein